MRDRGALVRRWAAGGLPGRGYPLGDLYGFRDSNGRQFMVCRACLQHCGNDGHHLRSLPSSTRGNDGSHRRLTSSVEERDAREFSLIGTSGTLQGENQKVEVDVVGYSLTTAAYAHTREELANTVRLRVDTPTQEGIECVNQPFVFGGFLRDHAPR